MTGKLEKTAFTLAEVLITLGIIGIVAAMTMPTLIAKYKEKQTVTAVKVAYATFSQVFLQLANEYGSISALATSQEEGDAGARENANNTIKAMKKYIKTIKTCDTDTKCFGVKYQNLDRSFTLDWDDFQNLQTGKLANGMSFWVMNHANSIQLGVDINGKAKPNVLGEDFFHFSIADNGKFILNRSQSLCNKNRHDHHLNGYYCTDYVLQHENMDYLKD